MTYFFSWKINNNGNLVQANTIAKMGNEKIEDFYLRIRTSIAEEYGVPLKFVIAEQFNPL